MIGYVMVGTNDLDQSIKFYDKLLEVLDLERTEKDEVCAGYSQKNNNGKIEWIKRFRYPNSLGLFYSSATRLMGLKPLCDESQVMAAARG